MARKAKHLIWLFGSCQYTCIALRWTVISLKAASQSCYICTFFEDVWLIMFDFIHFSSLTKTGCWEYRTQNHQFYSSILMTRMLILYISKLCLETVISDTLLCTDRCSWNCVWTLYFNGCAARVIERIVLTHWREHIAINRNYPTIVLWMCW